MPSSSLDNFLDSFNLTTVRSKIVDAAQRYGVNPALALALAESESDFDQWATSKTGARGVFQFTQRTATDMGIDREDLDQNIDGGVRYLGQLLGESGNDQRKAVSRFKGVSAGGATDKDVDRTLGLVAFHSNGDPTGNPYSDTSATAQQEDWLDEFLDDFIPVPSRAEIEAQSAELQPQSERINSVSAEMQLRRQALEEERATLRHSDQVPAFDEKLKRFNADLAAFQKDYESFDLGVKRLQTSAKLFDKNAAKIAGRGGLLSILAPGVPPARMQLEPVSLDMMGTKPEETMFQPEDSFWGSSDAAKMMERFTGRVAQAVPGIGIGVGDFIKSQYPEEGPARFVGMAIAASGETVANFYYQPPKDEKDLEQWSRDWWADVTGSAMGSMIGFAGTAKATAGVIGRLLGLSKITGKAAQVTKAAGMLTTGSALEVISQAGSDAAEAAAQGKTPEEAAEIARTSAMFSAPPTVLFNALGLYNPAARSAVKRAVFDYGAEIAQENSQQIASNYATGRPLFEGLTESTVGAMFATGVGQRILRSGQEDAPAGEQPPGPPSDLAPVPGLPEEAGPPTPSAGDADLRARALDLAQKSPTPISARDVVDEGVGPKSASEALEALVADGKLERIKQGNRSLYTVPGSQKKSDIGEGWKPPGALTPAGPASEEHKQQVLQLAQREGRITPGGIVNSLNIPIKQARGIMSELIAAEELNSRGHYIGKTAADKRADRQAPLTAPEPETTYEAPEASSVPAERRGKTAEVVTPQGTTAQAEWVLVELADVVASHDLAGNQNDAYPQQYQGRQRERVASQAQIEEMARTFDPEQAAESRLSSAGAPIDVIGEDGRQIVVSGNGRTLAQRLMYQLHPQRSQAYRKHLAAVLEQYGIDPAQLKGMKAPSLRRVLKGPVALARFASESNAETVARRSASEVAAADAAKLTPELLRNFKAAETGEIGTTENAEFVRAFFDTAIPAAERGEYMQPDGTLSQAGERRLRNAIFARAYGDVAGVERLAESRDDAARSISDGMLRAAPAVAQMTADVDSGNLHALDTSADIAAAARKFSYLRSRKLTVEGYLAQQPMFERELSPEAEQWLQVFDEHGRAPKRVGEILTAYVDAVRALGHPDQQRLFDEGGALPTKLDVIQGALGSVTGEEQKPQPAIPPPSEPKPAKETAPTMPEWASIKLPANLAGAKPRYAYGAKEFTLEFEADLNRAAYTTAQATPNKRDADYLRFVMENTGLPEARVRSSGSRIKTAIKAQAKDAEPGLLKIPAMDMVAMWKQPQADLQAKAKPEKKPAAPSLFDQPPVAARKPPTDQQVAEALKANLEADGRAAAERLKARLSNFASETGGQFTPERMSAERVQGLIEDLRVVGAWKISAGAVRLQTFTDSMVAELGEWVREHIGMLHQAALDHFEAAGVGTRGQLEGKPEAPRPAVAPKPEPVAPSQPKPEPAADLYPRAVALAKEKGRVTTSAIAEELGVPREEARKLFARMVRERVVNPVGKLVRAEAEPVKAESKKEPEYDYASTQVNLSGPVAKRLIEAAARIPEQDLAEDGRETQPHVTLLYGLHGEDPEAVKQLLESEPPIRLKLGKAAMFPNGESEAGDVVKVDVESEDLRRLNEKIRNALPNTQTQPGYKPHVTIAYVKPGLGKKYAGKPVPGVSGQQITLDRIVFSDRGGQKTEIELRGKHVAAAKPKPAAKRPARAKPPREEPQLGLFAEPVLEPEAKPKTPPFITKPPEIRKPAEEPEAAPSKAEEQEEEQTAADTEADRAILQAALDPLIETVNQAAQVRRTQANDRSVREVVAAKLRTALVTAEEAHDKIDTDHIVREDLIEQMSRARVWLKWHGETSVEDRKLSQFTKGDTIHWTDPDGRKLYGLITSVSRTEYRVRAHPADRPSDVDDADTQTIEYVPFDAQDLVGPPDYGSPAQAEEPAQEEDAPPRRRFIARIRQAIDSGEDIRLRLEKLAQEIYGGSRAQGSFSKREIYEAQEAAVNSWLRDHSRRLHSMEFREAETELRAMLSRLATQTVRDTEQIEMQQFSTPPTISYLVARLAAPQPSDVALEPSSGTGGLAALIDLMVGKLHLNELDVGRAELAVAAGLPPATQYNAEVISAHMAAKISPDLVVMNPPFTRGALQHGAISKNKIKYGWSHLQSALQLLKPKGRLVAILAGGRDSFKNKEGSGLMVPAAQKYWNPILQKFNVRAVVRLAGKEYAKMGTTMPVVVAVIDKSGPTPGSTFAERAANVLTGDFATVEEAFDALQEISTNREVAAVRDSAVDDDVRVPGSTGDLLAGVPAFGDEPLSPAGRTGGHSPGPVGVGPERPGPTAQTEEPRSPTDRRAGETAPDGATEGAAEDIPSAGRSGVLDIEAAEPSDVAAAEETDTGDFVVYKPSIKGQPHQGLLVETRTMASVKTPPSTYKPSLPQEIIGSGKVSAAQLEGVVMAGQANETILGDGSRGAALIGDGTGVGKGREIAAISLDNWNKGRKRIVWVTDNWRLIEDARRDLVDIGALQLARTLKRADKFQHGTPIGHVGLLFAPYTWIRGKSLSEPPQHRIDQLIKWVVGEDEGDGAVVIFDESHNLKNTEPAPGITPSQTGLAVRKLLANAPKLRTTYMSATAATELRNLGYLSRLGLWGAKTPFPAGFSEFLSKLGAGGMSAMEMLARELKATGRYLSRTISYKGVILREDAVHTLNPDQKAIYRTAAETWREVLDWVAQGLQAANAGTAGRSAFNTQFYGGQLRFFSILLTTMKVPTAVAETRAALEQGFSVVVSLINTNEATQKRVKEKLKESEEEVDPDDLDFGPKEILTNLVRDHFPTTQWIDGVDAAGNAIKVQARDEDGKILQNPESVKLREDLLAKLDKELHLPQNPLDMLIDELGGRSAVAELTGRLEIYDPNTGKFIPRGGKVPRHKLNIVEAQAFQQGKKRIAVISNAAATGISLHADRTKRNQQKRLHITLQVGWSADKAMQMLGRTHRTNQKQPPEYLMVVSDIGGEKRFISTIAKRLGTLGALTKGSRGAAAANADQIAKVNFDSREGRQAANGLYNYLLSDQGVPGADISGITALKQMGVLTVHPGSGQQTVRDEDRQNVNRLLNRILALDPDVQNGVYDLYYDLFERAVTQALADGTLDVGVRELPGEQPKIIETTTLATDSDTGAETYHYEVETQIRRDRLAVEGLERLQQRHPDGKIYRTVHGRTGEAALAFAWEAKPIIHVDGRTEDAVYVVRPDRARPMKSSASRMSYQKTLAEELRNSAATPIKIRLQQLRFRRGQWERSLKFRALAKEQAEHKKEMEELSRDIVEAEKQLAETPEGRLQNKAEMDSHLDYLRRDLNNYEKYRLDNPAAAARYDQQIDRLKSEIATAEKELAELPVITDDDIAALEREIWQEAHDATPEVEPVRYNLIGGTVLRWWGVLTESGATNIYGVQDAETGERIVGVDVQPTQLRNVIGRISGGASSVTPRQIWRDVLDNATPYTLSGYLRITRGRVSREEVVRFHPTPQQGAVITGLGVTYERGVVPVYWIPRSERGFEILEHVLEQYPVETGSAGERGGATVDFLTFGAQLIRDGVVNFATWSERMIRQFGQAVKRNLTRMYFEAKKLAADESGEFRPGAIQQHFTTSVEKALRSKNPAKALGHGLKDSFVAKSLEWVGMPMEWRIEQAGKGAGRPIMEMIRTARDWGKVSGGKRLVEMAPAEMSDLSRDQRFNLLDVLQGVADPVDAAVDRAFRVVRPILDSILAEAQALDVVVARRRGGRGVRTPIEAIENYYPQVVREMRALKRGRVRRDVATNLVRRGITDTEAEAKAFIDEYVEFIEGGGRLDRLLAYLQATKQATSPADALEKLDRYRTHIRRHGSLEYSREINLPLYDPDPARVLPAHIVSTSARLAQIAELGQNNEAIVPYIYAIAKNGDNHMWVKRQIDGILGWINDTDDAEVQLSRFLRATQIAKLGLAAIPNASQTFNTLLATDLPAVAAGIGAAFTRSGRLFALESGALLDQFVDASVRDIARTSRVVQVYLTAVGFSPIERMNRIIAANAGAHYAKRLLAKLQKSPQHKRARRILTEFGVDVDAALKRGHITGDELLLSANRLSQRAQFTAARENYPVWAATPIGKIAFQFKTFIYSQTRFVGREFTGSIGDRDWLRLLRTLFLLTVLTQPIGEAIGAARTFFTGRERDEEGFERWLDNIAQVGGVGILWDMLQAAQYSPLSFIAGPSAGTIADVWKTVGTDPLDFEKWKRLTYRHGPIGRVIQRAVEGPPD